MHFAEVLKMAQETKRVLVLPNCQHGYIGNSKFFSLPLCLCFDVEKIGSAVDWVTEEFFLKRAADFHLRGNSPSIGAVYFIREPVCNPVRNLQEISTFLLDMLDVLMFLVLFYVNRGRFSGVHCQRIFGNRQGISQCLFLITGISYALRTVLKWTMFLQPFL